MGDGSKGGQFKTIDCMRNDDTNGWD